MVETLLSEGGVALARWVSFAGTLLAIGVVMLRRVSPEDCATTPVHRIARLAGWCLLAGAVLRMAQQALLFAPAPEEALGMVGTLVAMPWGYAWMVQVAASLVLVFAPRRVAVPEPPVTGTLVALAVAFVPALQGHALGSERLTTLAMLADGLHVLAGGLWLGTLGVLLLVTFRRRDVALADVVARFSPIALVGVGMIVVSGVFGSWLHVTPLSALWQSPYGLMLVRKLVVFGVIGALGALNWKRLTPRLRDAGAATQLRRAAAFEVLAGILLLLLTSYLVATPLPGE
ncbi:MAG: CopD family protein [Gemmatimonadetes bacterium]|nr:CopD family protein [Gemmatimonadota bacterium]